MTGDDYGDKDGQVRMELKYCEHCGGLWVREGGGGVYCEKCQGKVADLPAAKKKPGRIVLPAGRRAIVEDYEAEAAGGVA
ncbi:MAG TPA: hypothetical protein VFD30_07385 [Terriglobia bacterium]|nr:hypothetical protein [Terriglobia bacterium]